MDAREKYVTHMLAIPLLRSVNDVDNEGWETINLGFYQQ